MTARICQARICRITLRIDMNITETEKGPEGFRFF